VLTAVEKVGVALQRQRLFRRVVDRALTEPQTSAQRRVRAMLLLQPCLALSLWVVAVKCGVSWALFTKYCPEKV
jgi:hypothetical protein